MAKPVLYTKAAQAAANGGTGYAKNERVLRDGTVWRSLVNNNMRPPAEHFTWDLDA